MLKAVDDPLNPGIWSESISYNHAGMQEVPLLFKMFGMLVSFLMGLNMSSAAITAALALVVLDFNDTTPCLEKVSYSLLVFFCGMFMTVDGFNRTGIPRAVWDFMEQPAQIDHISGVAILTVVIVVLSNLASNVPIDLQED
ncbi:hypothetical protein L2E82_30562 [Cichorium intybus]|uniref:Uncharacterized protein n=1 Tax=Cichorium intybus TaxID=13427 RepID=A0ACB9D171_CICIN|nr:hypothetical protein L2E82_30562 [Cichorium intybus]